MKDKRKDSYFYKINDRVVEVSLEHPSSGVYTYLPQTPARFSWIRTACLHSTKGQALAAPNAEFRHSGAAS